MDTLLIVVTGLSLAMAIAMAGVAMKLLRDERRRSDARVAALSNMAGGLTPEVTDVRVKSDATDFRLKPEATDTKRDVRTPRAVARFGDLDLRPDAPAVAGVSELFAEPERSSPWGRRFAVIGTLAAMILATGFVLTSRGPSTTAGASSAPPAAATPAAGVAPLELLSLRHAQEAERLTITGLVQNPRGAAPLTRVVATAFAFGPDGTFLAGGRAPIDFTSLGAGDESPFVITVPVSGTVERYRVGFRAEDGSVIAHVDKRSDTLAQK